MTESLPFLSNWDHYMVLGTYGFAAVGILIFLYYELRIMMIRDYKEKYDYVNLHEIKYFWYAVFSFIIAAGLYFNTFGSESITESGEMLWFWVRLFIVVSGVMVFYFIFSSMIKIYYPGYLEKRLHKLRTTPRMSPAGNAMRRLSEEEEDDYLDAQQIAEEAGGDGLHAVDYDVWLDDKTGFKKVERYLLYQHAEECPECGYYTLKIDREELEKKPTETEDGLLIKHYKCDYCKHRERREDVLRKLPVAH
jgi:hypothetical protein